MSDRRTPPDANATLLQNAFWEQVRDLFQRAVELPRSERAAFLREACGGDQKVLAEVESLLASHELAGDFIEPSNPQSSFNPGSVIAERYRIVRRLGQGGMGEVFEAEDLELHEPVALKVIRPEIAGNPRILLRFKREIQLARRVTHPNVCRIYDVSHHLSSSTGAATGDRKITFVSMELLQGETLAQRLDRDGRLAASVALPFVLQIAAGLSAAHKASIVHRDLKSANVMLIPDETAPGSTRVVVTDFGLALQTGEDGFSKHPSLTDTGAMIGTPHYMAPEQLENGPVSPATDIYALGVVMYEMVTGRLPFSGTTPLAVAVSRLSQAAPSPRRWVPDLDPRWEAVILRCLERDPKLRFQDAGVVAKALDRASPMPRLPPATTRRSLKRALWLLIPAAVVALPIVMKNIESRDPAKTASGASPVQAVKAKQRRVVAVVGFRNLSERPDAAWLSNAFMEMFNSELSAGDQLRVVSGEEVAQMKADLHLGEADLASRATLDRIRKHLSADLVVSGSYVAPGDNIRLDIRLLDTVSGQTIGTVSESGTEAGLLDLISRTGARLRDQLGTPRLTQGDVAGLRASRPADPEAARDYIDGLQKLRHFDDVGARTLLERVIARTPQYPMAHAALAEALLSLGYETDAQPEIEKALSLSGQLGREERLSIEARSSVMHRQWDKAIELYRSLFTFYPDELSYGIRLAMAQISAGKGKDALVTIGAMRKLPAPLRDDAGIDLVEADAWRVLTNPQRELELARSAEKKGNATGSRSLVLRAKGNQAYALRDLGKLDDSMKLLEEQVRISDEMGDRGSSARALTNLATTLWQRGDLKAAKAGFERALMVQQQMDSRSFVARTLNNLGNVRAAMGDLVGAERSYRDSIALSRETNSTRLLGTTLGNLGGMRQLLGDLDGAGRYYQEAIEVSRRTDDRLAEDYALVNVAEVLRLKAHFPEAQKRYEESLQLARQISNTQNESYVLAAMGELALARGQFDEAARKHDAALLLRQKAGEKLSVAQSQVMIANLAIQSGKMAGAEVGLQAAIVEFRKEQAVEDESQAHETYARLQLIRKQLVEAQSEIAMSRKLAAGSHNVPLLASIATTEARVLIAAGRYDAAAKKATEAVATAKSSQLALAELDALLAVAENDAHRGRTEEATKAVAAIHATAVANGIKLIADKSKG